METPTGGIVIVHDGFPMLTRVHAGNQSFNVKRTTKILTENSYSNYVNKQNTTLSHLISHDRRFITNDSLPRYFNHGLYLPTHTPLQDFHRMNYGPVTCPCPARNVYRPFEVPYYFQRPNCNKNSLYYDFQGGTNPSMQLSHMSKVSPFKTIRALPKGTDVVDACSLKSNFMDEVKQWYLGSTISVKNCGTDFLNGNACRTNLVGKSKEEVEIPEEHKGNTDVKLKNKFKSTEQRDKPKRTSNILHAVKQNLNGTSVSVAKKLLNGTLEPRIVLKDIRKYINTGNFKEEITSTEFHQNKYECHKTRNIVVEQKCTSLIHDNNCLRISRDQNFDGLENFKTIVKMLQKKNKKLKLKRLRKINFNNRCNKSAPSHEQDHKDEIIDQPKLCALKEKLRVRKHIPRYNITSDNSNSFADHFFVYIKKFSQNIILNAQRLY
ncbi:uncharacterized protein LOC130636571 [Hydractinia symbiolongicarpus]|uniref:uncharacterized protein LOC130636571 n=1 Tax=Hydractinia symbiolongicarpus TaxID=13093 RepID=UPI0025517602|nr:uncharacterized protein LOC130636571 [Hydractinia symbiolongicarpus]